MKQQQHKEASVYFGLQLGNIVHRGVDGMGMTLGRQGGRGVRQLLNPVSSAREQGQLNAGSQLLFSVNQFKDPSPWNGQSPA